MAVDFKYTVFGLVELITQNLGWLLAACDDVGHALQEVTLRWSRAPEVKWSTWGEVEHLRWSGAPEVQWSACNQMLRT